MRTGSAGAGEGGLAALPDQRCAVPSVHSMVVAGVVLVVVPMIAAEGAEVEAVLPLVVVATTVKPRATNSPKKASSLCLLLLLLLLTLMVLVVFLAGVFADDDEPPTTSTLCV